MGVLAYFPDGTLWRLHEHWRERLVEAQSRYTENRNKENREEYLRMLKVFTNLVVRDEMPEDGR